MLEFKQKVYPILEIWGIVSNSCHYGANHLIRARVSEQFGLVL